MQKKNGVERENHACVIMKRFDEGGKFNVTLFYSQPLFWSVL